MASSESTVRWRRRQGIRPREEVQDRSGQVTCKDCGIVFERVRAEAKRKPDGLHYVYRDLSGNKLNGHRCHACTVAQCLTYSRKYGHKPRHLLTDHANKRGYESEVKVLAKLQNHGLDAQLGPHKGMDIIVNGSIGIEVKTASKEMMINVHNKYLHKNLYVAVVFPDDRIFVVNASEILQRVKKIPTVVSCRNMLPEYTYKRGPKPPKFNSILPIDVLGEELCSMLKNS